MNRLVHLVNGTLLALLFGGSLWAYPMLPEQIPRHFGLYGQADAYWATTLLHWMLIPFVAIFSGAIVYGSGWLIGRVPERVTVPNQGRYEQLSDRDKHVITTRVQRAVYWMAAPLLVVFGACQVGIYHVATTSDTALPSAVMVTMGGGILLILGIAVGLGWWLRRRTRQRADADDPTT